MQLSRRRRLRAVQAPVEDSLVGIFDGRGGAMYDSIFDMVEGLAIPGKATSCKSPRRQSLLQPIRVYMERKRWSQRDGKAKRVFHLVLLWVVLV